MYILYCAVYRRRCAVGIFELACPDFAAGAGVCRVRRSAANYHHLCEQNVHGAAVAAAV